MSLEWISAPCGGWSDLVAWSGNGGALCVCLEAVASVSSVADKLVVIVARGSIKSCNCCPDSSSDDRRSGGGWALFLFLVMDVFFVGFICVFNLGAILENSPREIKSTHVSQLAAKYRLAAVGNK